MRKANVDENEVGFLLEEMIFELTILFVANTQVVTNEPWQRKSVPVR